MSLDRSTIVPVVEEIIRIQRGIPVLLVERAVKLVRAGLLISADEGSSATAVLGAHAVGKDGEILDGLERRIDVDGTSTEVVIVFCSIEHV